MPTVDPQIKGLRAPGAPGQTRAHGPGGGRKRSESRGVRGVGGARLTYGRAGAVAPKCTGEPNPRICLLFP